VVRVTRRLNTGQLGQASKQWLGNRLWSARASRLGSFENSLVSDSKDDRSAPVKAYAMASEVIAVAGSMVIPGLLGLWLDSLLATQAVFTIVGFGLGLILGIWRLVNLSS
jgi:F0F1-type ATP synthase assembly protein I